MNSNVELKQQLATQIFRENTSWATGNEEGFIKVDSGFHEKLSPCVSGFSAFRATERHVETLLYALALC